MLFGCVCSNFEGDFNDIDIGDEVDFTLARKTNKVSAESIRKLKPGTVAPEEIKPTIYDGKIIRCMRIVNPEQSEYPGLVQTGEDDGQYYRFKMPEFPTLLFMII